MVVGSHAQWPYAQSTLSSWRRKRRAAISVEVFAEHRIEEVAVTVDGAVEVEMPPARDFSRCPSP